MKLEKGSVACMYIQPSLAPKISGGVFLLPTYTKKPTQTVVGHLGRMGDVGQIYRTLRSCVPTPPLPTLNSLIGTMILLFLKHEVIFNFPEIISHAPLYYLYTILGSMLQEETSVVRYPW
jgi:hypothetical protein